MRNPPWIDDPAVLRDISIPLHSRTPVWPGDPPVRVTPVRRISDGSPYNLEELHLGTHTGTHIDAPRHLFHTGTSADRTPLHALVGPAVVLDLEGIDPIDASDLDAAWNSLEKTLPSCRHGSPWHRILLKTNGSTRWATWLNSPSQVRDETLLEQGFPGLTLAAARRLIQRGVRLVGLDGPSIDAVSDGFPAHNVLLQADVAILECLDLCGVEPGAWFLCALPLPVVGTGGAPVRAVLMRFDPGDPSPKPS